MSRAAIATSLVWGALASIALYATLRFVQVALTNEPFPTAVLLSGSIAYFWRCATALFGGALMTFAAFVVAQRDATAAARPLPVAVVAVTLFLAAQALLAP